MPVRIHYVFALLNSSDSLHALTLFQHTFTSLNSSIYSTTSFKLSRVRIRSFDSFDLESSLRHKSLQAGSIKQHVFFLARLPSQEIRR